MYLTNFLSSWGMELWHKLTSSSLETVNLNKVFILCFRFINSQGKGSPDLWLSFLRCSLLCWSLQGGCDTIAICTKWIPCLYVSGVACGSCFLLLSVYSAFPSQSSEHEFLCVGRGRMLGGLWCKTSGTYLVCLHTCNFCSCCWLK